MCVCIYAYEMYTSIYVCMKLYICVYTCVYARMHICAYVYVCIYKCICIYYVCMYVFTYECIYIYARVWLHGVNFCIFLSIALQILISYTYHQMLRFREIENK